MPLPVVCVLVALERSTKSDGASYSETITDTPLAESARTKSQKCSDPSGVGGVPGAGGCADSVSYCSAWEFTRTYSVPAVVTTVLTSAIMCHSACAVMIHPPPGPRALE